MRKKQALSINNIVKRSFAELKTSATSKNQKSLNLQLMLRSSHDSLEKANENACILQLKTQPQSKSKTSLNELRANLMKNKYSDSLTSSAALKNKHEIFRMPHSASAQQLDEIAGSHLQNRQ